jgi:hypothetical protein
MTRPMHPSELPEMLSSAAAVASRYLLTFPADRRELELERLARRFAAMPSLQLWPDEMQFIAVRTFLTLICERLWEHPDGAMGSA